MTKILTRYLLVLFACWLMLGQTGLAWKSATCIFTGSVKYGWGTRVACCQKSKPAHQNQVSRASCCTYDQFQVKLTAEQSFKLVHFDFVGMPTNQSSFSFDTRFHPKRILLIYSFSSPPPSVRRALTQVYLI